ncbi:MAG: hypothetical protein ACRDQZ_20590 [Mycobacteriales bacterium]
MGMVRSEKLRRPFEPYGLSWLMKHPRSTNHMLKSFLQKRRAKRFLKMIGSTDLEVTNATAQIFWASLCARSAWKSFTNDVTVMPVGFADEHATSLVAGEWMAFQAPSAHMRLVANDETEAFDLQFDIADPKELIADPDVQTVLGRAYDLLEATEECVWELPPQVNAATHKLRTAIQRHVQKEISEGGIN